jgi:hypothetical protein
MRHFICTTIVLKRDLFQLYTLAAILFFVRKRGGCRHVARGHCDGRHFVSFL